MSQVMDARHVLWYPRVPTLASCLDGHESSSTCDGVTLDTSKTIDRHQEGILVGWQILSKTKRDGRFRELSEDMSRFSKQSLGLYVKEFVDL